MVAYSFQARFCRAVAEGTKRQTIRSPRKRHARIGEDVQLYFGMRTRYCRLLGRGICTSVAPIAVASDHGHLVVHIDGRGLVDAELTTFTLLDGFRGVDDFVAFWSANHGMVDNDIWIWRGVLICWAPRGHEGEWR